MVKNIDTMSVKELRQALKSARKEYMPPVSKMKRGSLISEYVRMKKPGETLSAEEILFEKQHAVKNIRRAVPDMPKVLGASEVSRTRPSQRVREGGGEKTLIGAKKAPERMADVETMEGMELVEVMHPKKKKANVAKMSVEVQTDHPVAASTSDVVGRKKAKKSVKQVDEPVEAAMSAVPDGKQLSIKKFMQPKMEVGREIASADVPISLVVEPFSSGSEYSTIKKKPIKTVPVREPVEGVAAEPNITNLVKPAKKPIKTVPVRQTVVEEEVETVDEKPKKKPIKTVPVRESVLRNATIDENTGEMVFTETKKVKKPKGERVAKEVVKIESKRPPSEYNKFVAARRKQGMTMSEIAFEWKNRE